MRILADCGSTSCKWVIEGLTERLTGPGLNPTVMWEEEFEKRIKANTDLWNLDERTAVSEVRYFGAGCSTPSAQKRMHNALTEMFPHAKIQIQSDLLAACLALYAGKPIAIGILGTGSAAAGFDGKEPVYRGTPSLGYVLGDEGAGSAIGRSMLSAYLYKEMPAELSDAFDLLFPDTTVEKTLNTFYGSEASGGKLAEYTRFAVKYAENPFVRERLQTGFEEFIQRHMVPLQKKGFLQAGLIGSVAFGFREIIRPLLTKAGFETVTIMNDPLDSLPQKIWVENNPA